MGANQHTSEGRTFPHTVMLTAEEDARVRELAQAYGTTIADILRGGITARAFRRERIPADVTCPKCNSLPWRSCTGMAWGFHVERIEAAQEVDTPPRPR